VKSFIVWFFVSTNLIFALTTSVKIQNSKNDLSKTDTAKKDASRKLENIATDIAKAEKDINYLDTVLEKLSQNKDKVEKEFQRLKVDLKNSDNTLHDMNSAIEKKKKVFLGLLSDQFSIVYAMQQFDNPTNKSLISYEVYKVYKKQNAQELKELKQDIHELRANKIYTQKEHDKTQKSIAGIIQKRKSFNAQKEAKKQLLVKLEEDEEKYQNMLQNIVDKQTSLSSTLAKLNILHTKEVQKARKRANAKRAAMRVEKERLRKIRNAKRSVKERARKARIAIRQAKTKEARQKAQEVAKKIAQEAKVVQKTAIKQSEKVRKINSSYRQPKTYAYRGTKTISPLAGARVVKKFGTYIDPVYKMKIFNESVTLKAASSGAKVKNVLNGKVVFAGKSSMLGKVVVVAHNGKIHTVYAGLSKIAPTIHTGSMIKKGYVIGKVTRKLIFQATKNSKHINPLMLIHI